LLANSTIQKAQAESRLEGLEQARARLQEAIQEYGNRKFADSIRTADNARMLAEKATRAPLIPPIESNMLVATAAIASILALALAIAYSKRRKKSAP